MSSEENRGKIASSSGTKDDKVGVNPLSTNAAQTPALLEDLLLQNQIQTEKLTRLFELSESLAARIVQGQKIGMGTDLSSHVHLLKQSGEKLEEEVEKHQKAIDQLEETINRLTKSSDA